MSRFMSNASEKWKTGRVVGFSELLRYRGEINVISCWRDMGLAFALFVTQTGFFKQKVYPNAS